MKYYYFKSGIGASKGGTTKWTNTAARQPQPHIIGWSRASSLSLPGAICDGAGNKPAEAGGSACSQSWKDKKWKGFFQKWEETISTELKLHLHVQLCLTGMAAAFSATRQRSKHCAYAPGGQHSRRTQVFQAYLDFLYQTEIFWTDCLPFGYRWLNANSYDSLSAFWGLLLSDCPFWLDWLCPLPSTDLYLR